MSQMFLWILGWGWQWMMVMGNSIHLSNIEEELRKVRDELTSLEEKIRKRRCREAYRQVTFIMDDLDKVIDMVEKYDSLSASNNEK